MLKFLLYFGLILILSAACNNNVRQDISSNESNKPNKSYEGKSGNIVTASNKRQIEKEFDPSEFPATEIHTIDELEEWINVNGSVVLSYFRSGSTDPYFAMKKNLIQHIVDQINSSEQNTYSLVGHTHNQGNKESNMRLSIDRARATMEVLLNEYGLQLSKNGAFGEGESNPLHSNETIDGRKLNSRVELRKLK